MCSHSTLPAVAALLPFFCFATQFQAANRRNPTGARTGIPRTSPARAPAASKTAKTPVRSSGRSDPSSRIPTSGSKRRADKFGVVRRERGPIAASRRVRKVAS